MSAFEPRFTITNAITAGLTTIERARGFLQAATLSEEWVRRMSQRALLLEAHHTTHIEGTQLTLEQSERVWAGEHVAEARPDDVRELLNYREAFNLVSEYLSSGEPVTEGWSAKSTSGWSKACAVGRVVRGAIEPSKTTS
jgi:Fic family protein